GIPRIVSSLNDYEFILNNINNTKNGITLCVGSLFSNFNHINNNNIIQFIKKYSHRIHFLHLRNIIQMRKNDFFSFVESNHLTGNADMYNILKFMILEQFSRNELIPIKSDHGHILLHDIHLINNNNFQFNSGYTLYGRFRGLCELRGVHMAIQRELNLIFHHQLMLADNILISKL